MDCGNESVESSSQLSSGRNFWNCVIKAELFWYYPSLLTAGEKSVYRTLFAKSEARCMILVFWDHTSYVVGPF